MNLNSVAGTVISCLVAFFILLYLFDHWIIGMKKDYFILLFIILNIISVAFLFYTSTENFYFEVSPQRKQCLIEQVSLDTNPLCPYCPQCCPKSTVGGSLPYYKEWLESNGLNGTWKRTDNVTTNPDSISYESQLPPTQLLS
jgi:hypothetical protein